MIDPIRRKILKAGAAATVIRCPRGPLGSGAGWGSCSSLVPPYKMYGGRPSLPRKEKAKMPMQIWAVPEMWLTGLRGYQFAECRACCHST